jgi:hypothetical protein
MKNDEGSRVVNMNTQLRRLEKNLIEKKLGPRVQAEGRQRKVMMRLEG